MTPKGFYALSPESVNILPQRAKGDFTDVIKGTDTEMRRHWRLPELAQYNQLSSEEDMTMEERSQICNIPGFASVRKGP